ncbi:MAG: CBS domain-containing protein [Planctomycetota bacterium]|jgi:CBS domain-containing protein
MLRARDIMTEEVVYVHKNTPISETIEVLVDNEITGLPVVEEDMTVVGVLSERDVLRLFDTYDQEGDRTAGEFMTQPPIYFDEDERVLDVSYRLRDCPMRRVPVTSEGKLTGIISRADILKCTLELMKKAYHANR